MKKSLVLILTVVMLFSFVGFGTTMVNSAANAEDTRLEISFSDIIDISAAGAGVVAGNNSGHGNHQTRNVHTSHGDYAAYITDSMGIMDQFSIVKINDDNTTEVVFQEYKVYDSSQVGLFVDKDENVWAVVVHGSPKDQFDNRPASLMAVAYKVDKTTGETYGYEVLVEREASGGYGYSSFCYDEALNKIYTITSSGDAPGALTWLIFDMNTLKWDNTARAIQTDYRQCYHYIYADGKGGMFVLNQRDIKASTNYPEIGNNNGLTPEELASFKRHDANYLWDQLELYYIPDVTDEAAYSLMVAEADYSRVTGTQDERYTLAKRLTNEYPNFQNNNGGDMFVDKDGYLHVIYAKEYLLAASTRERTERTWYHCVYDISDPANMKLLTTLELIDDSETTYDCSFRIYQDSKGQIMFISGQTDKQTSAGKVVVYTLDGNVEDGYEIKSVAEKEYTGSSIVHISNNRSNSVADDDVSILLYDTTSDYCHLAMSIDYVPEGDPEVGQNGMIYVWYCLMAASVAGLAVMVGIDKRKIKA